MDLFLSDYMDADNIGLVITLIVLAAFGIFAWCRRKSPPP